MRNRECIWSSSHRNLSSGGTWTPRIVWIFLCEDLCMARTAVALSRLIFSSATFLMPRETKTLTATRMRTGERFRTWMEHHRQCSISSHFPNLRWGSLKTKWMTGPRCFKMISRSSTLNQSLWSRKYPCRCSFLTKRGSRPSNSNYCLDRPRRKPRENDKLKKSAS